MPSAGPAASLQGSWLLDGVWPAAEAWGESVEPSAGMLGETAGGRMDSYAAALGITGVIGGRTPPILSASN
jgi:hypothetical protein